MIRSCFFMLLALHASQVIGQTKFTDATQEAGIDHYFEVFQGTFGGGAAVLDYDSDGWEDVFITGGSGPNALYRNNGDGTFTNMIANAGFADLDTVVTQGVVRADVNRDGHPDLFITTIASVNSDRFTAAANFLFINQGDGTFSNRTRSYGLTEVTFSTGAAFGDVNGDGFPDLFVGNYFDKFQGRLDDYSGVLTEGEQAPAGDLLYINNGGARFTESHEFYGINHTGLGFGGVFSDYDNDGDVDLIVINDFGSRATPNLLYRNDYPNPAFTDVSEETGFAIAMNAMGVGVGDYDQDGWLDYVISNISASPFLENPGLAGGAFLEKTKDVGVSYPIVYTDEGQGVPTISWGVNFFDYDNDTDLDLYLTNGCLNPSIVPNPNLFLENINGQYVLYGRSSGLTDPSIGRGSITFDYDKDGDLDLLVVNQSQYRDPDYVVETQGVRLFRNETATDKNWLQLQLRGETADREGLGSRIEVYAGGKVLIREIDGGSSHESQNSPVAHIGLGDASLADSVMVRWIGGGTQVLYGLEGNQRLEIVQDVITGLSESALPSVTLYPNPVRDVLTIASKKLPGSKTVRLWVYATDGRVVYRQEVKREQRTDLAVHWRVPGSLPSGVYLIKMTVGDELMSAKFFKE